MTLAGFSGALSGKDKVLKMKPCTARLPNHILEFAVPEEVAKGMSPRQIASWFDASEPFEKGYQPLTSTLYGFNGRSREDALGTLGFYVFVQQRSADFEGDITSAEGLEKYIAWWIPDYVKPALGGLARVTVNGVAAVSRGSGSSQEILSFPLDQSMFVEFGLKISVLSGTLAAGWVKRAEAMRDAIRASIVLRPRD